MIPLGVMVGLEDHKLLHVPGAQFRELLLFDGDLDRVTPEVIEELRASSEAPVSYVHMQEFVSVNGERRLLDLASDDERFRHACVWLVERTRVLAESLGGGDVVIHPGGIRRGYGDHDALLRNLRRSLSELGPEGLLLENMPWYYWQRPEGRMVSNICVSIDDLGSVQDLVEGFTLDTSHGYLSKEAGDVGFMRRFVGSFGAKTLHVHASDARAPDREGLQLGEGDIDFSFMKGLSVPTVVEIWRGHENGGLGFRTAIERFRAMEKTW